jgi:hypothetical protein
VIYADRPVMKMPWFKGYFFGLLSWGFIVLGRYKCQGEIPWSVLHLGVGPGICRMVDCEVHIGALGNNVEFYWNWPVKFIRTGFRWYAFRIPKPQ